MYESSIDDNLDYGRRMQRSLSDVSELLRRGISPSYVNSSTVMAIGQRCVQKDGFKAEAARPHDPSLLGRSLIAKPGDVLLNSTGTGTIGRSCVFDAEGTFVVDSHVTVIRVKRELVEPRWLDLLLRSPEGQAHLESHCFAGSTNQLELSRAELAETAIPVPALEEQRRVIAVLDALSELERSLGASIAKLYSVRHGILENVISSGRGVDYGTKSWLRVTLKDVADVGGGIALGGTATGAGGMDIPYLRVANVQNGHISTREMKTVRVTPVELKRFRLRRGDILLTEGGDLDKLGRGGVWDGRIDPCLHQNHIFRVRCVETRMIPEFLALYLSSQSGRGYFLRVAKQTTNLASVSSSQIKDMIVPCPPILEQRRVINVLTAHDVTIALEEQELVKLRSLKKGLVESLLAPA